MLVKIMILSLLNAALAQKLTCKRPLRNVQDEFAGVAGNYPETFTNGSPQPMKCSGKQGYKGKVNLKCASGKDTYDIESTCAPPPARTPAALTTAVAGAPAAPTATVEPTETASTLQDSDTHHGDDVAEVETENGNRCHWTYEDKHCDEADNCIYGPADWPSIPKTALCSHDCDKTDAQSPINIRPENAVVDATQPPTIKFNWNDSPEGWHKDPKDGLSVHATCTNCTPTVTATSPTQPDEKVYTLVQTHFHTPSEHTLGGKFMAGEIHFVHQHSATEFAVVGIFLEESDSPDELAIDLFGPSGVEYAEGGDIGFHFIGNDEITPRFTSLLKEGGLLRQGFYQYKGGFTTPPCSELVQWHVMKTPLKVHKDTILAHKKLNGGLLNEEPLHNITEHNLNTQDNTPIEDQLPRYCVQGSRFCASDSAEQHTQGNNRPTVNESNQQTVYSVPAEASGPAEGDADKPDAEASGPAEGDADKPDAVESTGNIETTTSNETDDLPDVEFLVSGYNKGSVHRININSSTAEGIKAGTHKNMSWFVKIGKDVYGTQEAPDWADREKDLRTLIHMKENEAGDEWRVVSELLSTATGAGPAHIHEAHYDGATTLYVSNYGGASLTVVKLDKDGNLPSSIEDKNKYTFTCGDKTKTSRPHETVTRGKFVWVVDLGCNTIRQFTRNEEDGSLKSNDEAQVPADRGDNHRAYANYEKVNVHYNRETETPKWSKLSPCPRTSPDAEVETLDRPETLEPKPRHIALHPTLDQAYVVLEGQPYVERYAIQSRGALEFKQRVVLTDPKFWDQKECGPYQTLSEWSDETVDNLPYYGAEIVVSRNGKNVYASSRRSQDPSRADGNGIITVYKVTEDATLEKVQEYELEGKWCRSMQLTGDDAYLAVALQDMDTVQFLSLTKVGLVQDSVRTVSVEGINPGFIVLGQGNN